MKSAWERLENSSVINSSEVSLRDFEIVLDCFALEIACSKMPENRWIISATQAKQLILSRAATVLDVRNKLSWLLGHVPGAVHITWQQFSQPKRPNKGKLIESQSVLAQKLRAVGISNNKPVIVVGTPAHNFGEEGRIVWMLHTLGHNQAVFVDGGQAALIAAGVPIESGVTPPPATGDFVVKRTALWEITADQLQANLAAGTDKICVIDTREPREYAGAIPYGESRGGHIPKAVHFYYRDLLDSKGYLLHDQVISQLNQLGIYSNTAIAAYCTGGIRSAFFVAVLADLGFTNVKNYAGSMWEWSSREPSSYPLVKSD